MDQGLLSVEVRDAFLADLLNAIGEQVGFQVTIHVGGADLVTQSLTSVPLEEAIRRLAIGRDVVMIYGSPANRGATGHLVEVHVYAASPLAGPAPLSGPATGGSSQRGAGPATADSGQRGAGPVTADSGQRGAGPATADSGQRRAGPATVNSNQRNVDPTVSDSSQRDAQLEVVRSLVDQAYTDAVPSLSSILSTNSNAVVREAAAGALGRILDGQGVLALRAAVEDQDPGVRSTALLSLGQLFEEGSAGIMARLLANDPDVNVRRAAVTALAALQGMGALRALQTAAFDPDAGIRQVAENALLQWQNRPRSN